MTRTPRTLLTVWRDDGLRARAALALLLRVYAGCLFSGSPWAGAFVLAATLLSPFAGLLGVLAVVSALATAYGLGVVSERNSPTLYTYSALFIGLGASRMFGQPLVAAVFTIIGAAATALLTASLREASLRFALPSLSVPFVIVYGCALGCGRQLGLRWALPVWTDPDRALLLPQLGRSFLEALGAIVFNASVETGALVLLALATTSIHALLLAALGYAVAHASGGAFGFDPMLRFSIEINAVFACLALGIGWAVPLRTAYARALAGALLCSVLTPSLMRPFGALELAPLSLPFNLSVWSVLLVARAHIDVAPTVSSLQPSTAATTIRHM